MAISDIRISSPDGINVVILFNVANGVRAYVSQSDMAGTYDPANDVQATGLGGGEFRVEFQPVATLFKFQCIDLFTGETTGDRVFEVFQLAPSTGTVAADKATVSWNTPFDGDETVLFGTDQANLAQMVNDGDVGQVHQVELSGLTASTQYFYQCLSKPVGAGNMDDYEVEGPILNFTTPGGAPPPSPDKIDVSVSKDVMKRGEQITVTAVVKANGIVVPNVPVVFSFLLLPRGTFNPNPVTTNVQGQAVTTLTAGQLPGPALIVVKCQTAAGGKNIWIRWA